MRGIFSFHPSTRRRPDGVFFHFLNQIVSSTTMIAISQPHRLKPWLMPMRMRVGSGSAAPIESNTFWNCGMIHTSAAMTASTPKQSTTIG